jgi:hypothetical protein
MTSLYFALLNKAMAVEECDATGDAMKYNSRAQKKTFNYAPRVYLCKPFQVF